MSNPAEFQVDYVINPWMKPLIWAGESGELKRRAVAGWSELRDVIQRLGAVIEEVPAHRGLPDLAFPANAAVVFDGRALMARFRFPERQREEPVFRSVFEGLRERGILREVVALPEDLVLEGAGDCIWDAGRGLFWSGYGPRSGLAAAGVVEDVFAREVVSLELATSRFYHLDTCFCILSGGEVMFCPDAFSREGLRRIHERVLPEKRIAADAEEAATFCLNAVCIGRSIISSPMPARLKSMLRERGYHVIEIALAPFHLAGGSACCLTLRLDVESRPAAAEALADAAPVQEA